jgi:hypothetical protein
MQWCRSHDHHLRSSGVAGDSERGARTARRWMPTRYSHLTGATSTYMLYAVDMSVRGIIVAWGVGAFRDMNANVRRH